MLIYITVHYLYGLGDEFSATFLIKNDCSVSTTMPETRETALHLVASYQPGSAGKNTVEGMTNVATLLLEKGASANVQDCNFK